MLALNIGDGFIAPEFQKLRAMSIDNQAKLSSAYLCNLMRHHLRHLVSSVIQCISLHLNLTNSVDNYESHNPDHSDNVDTFVVVQTNENMTNIRALIINKSYDIGVR